jgi:transcriptional regulator with XRE-family HTH domain
MIRNWRRRRRLSLSALALDTDLSARQLRLIEAGHGNPDRQVWLSLAARLNMPLEERNALLHAAGFSPVFPCGLCQAALERTRHAVQAVLAAHEPNPAAAINHHWTVLSENRALSRLVGGADPLLLRPPVNLLRLALHPAGLAPRIINLPEWRGATLTRLRRRIDLTGDAVLRDLLDEILDYPCPLAAPAADAVPDAIAIPLRLASIEGEMAFLTTTTRFAMPIDITVSKLTIKAFLPADSATAALLHRAARDCLD